MPCPTWCSVLRGVLFCMMPCSPWWTVLRGALFCVVPCPTWCSILRGALYTWCSILRGSLSCVVLCPASCNSCEIKFRIKSFHLGLLRENKLIQIMQEEISPWISRNNLCISIWKHNFQISDLAVLKGFLRLRREAYPRCSLGKLTVSLPTSALLIRSTRLHIPKDNILHCYHREKIPEGSGLRACPVFLHGEATPDTFDEATAGRQ
jgi:hypothetical protein